MASIPYDQKMIRDLAKVLNEQNLSEIEIADGDKRVRVARQAQMVTAIAAPQPAAPAAAPQPPEPTAKAVPTAKMESHPGAVTSPMVGTAYAAAEPGATPFVKVGDTVSEGQTLMIIEAMKTFNPIPAPHAGKVTTVLFTDGQPVEYGQVLMIVE